MDLIPELLRLQRWAFCILIFKCFSNTLNEVNIFPLWVGNHGVIRVEMPRGPPICSFVWQSPVTTPLEASRDSCPVGVTRGRPATAGRSSAISREPAKAPDAGPQPRHGRPPVRSVLSNVNSRIEWLPVPLSPISPSFGRRRPPPRSGFKEDSATDRSRQSTSCYAPPRAADHIESGISWGADRTLPVVIAGRRRIDGVAVTVPACVVATQ